MNDTKRIKAELPTRDEIAAAEDVVQRLRECVQRLAYEDYVNVEYQSQETISMRPEWTVYIHGGTRISARNPLELIDSLFPDTDQAIARRKDEIARRRAELDAEAEQLQRLELEVRG